MSGSRGSAFGLYYETNRMAGGLPHIPGIVDTALQILVHTGGPLSTTVSDGY